MSNGSRRLALLHPGAMGVTVGSTLCSGGHRVRWLPESRSAATRQRAQQAGFEACDNLEELLHEADAVVSVCPPAAATALARRVADTGFAGAYLDANAISPDSVRRMSELFGAGLVDGGIVGPPARQAGTTRLYLSGPAAVEVAGWFSAGPLEAVAMDAPVGAASALKMCYAAYTKGASALLLAVRALAEMESVTPALLAEWSLSQPGLTERSERAAAAAAGKAWRFEGEMHEIADTFEAARLPDGFHRAAADLYRRMAPLKDQDAGLEQVLERLLRSDP